MAVRWIVVRRIDLLRLGLFALIFSSGLLLATGLAGIAGRALAAQQRDVPIYSVDTKEKKVAISIDAAWGADSTPKLLAILKQHNVKTTFFLTGIWVKKYPEMVQAIAAAGHEIGNHSLTHPHFGSLPAAEIKEELDKNDALIFKLTDKHTRLFRPPYGEYDNLVLQTARGMGYEVIQWSVDSLDWQNTGKEAIIDRVLKNVQPGAIILFHNNAQYTPEALPVILDALQQQGYQIVPVSDLLLKGNYYVERHSGAQKPSSRFKSDLPGLADHLLDLGVEELVGVGGHDHHRRIGAAARAAHGDDLLPIGDQPGVQGHAGNLHTDLDPLAEHSERLGDDLRRVEAVELVAQRPVHPRQEVGGGQQSDSLLRQHLPDLGRHLVLAGAQVADVVGDADQVQALVQELFHRVAAVGCHHGLPDVQLLCPLQGQLDGGGGVGLSLLLPIHDLFLLYDLN